ncbi:MAG: hypothetical protein N2C14_23085, partial [Planctomycetales bacterium]
VTDYFTGAPVIDPNTGRPIYEPDRRATLRNNFLYLHNVPLFYWPVMSSKLRDPSLILERIRVRNDRIFGTQVLTEWDLLTAFGIEAPPDTKWNLNLDYFSDRGPAAGTNFSHRFDEFLGIPGHGVTYGDIWGIKDTGLDVLGGFGRRDLAPEKEHRGRAFWRHRQYLWEEYRLTGEVGWISDRNFLEQYYETEWDEAKDQTTGFELWHARDNRSLSVSTDFHVNDFVTQTEWLPRADFFWLGQPLWGNRLTWFVHAHAGYGDFQPLTPPENPKELKRFTPAPWESPARGERVAVRSELDFPIQAGPVKVVPYLLSEFAHWGEDLTRDSLQRGYYQAGLRASMPMWATYPHAENDLLNVHGIAHKIVFEADAYFAEASENLDRLPLYDPLDDNSTEAFRNRIPSLTFNGTTPTKFDERYYAVRDGLASWVTSPSTEIAEDLQVVRAGVHQRWQTKRGMPGNRRIVDWITLDLDAAYFPDAERDNFGSDVGLATYDFRWHVGDRLA